MTLDPTPVQIALGLQLDRALSEMEAHFIAAQSELLNEHADDEELDGDYWQRLDALSDQFFTDSAAVRAMFPSEVQ